MNVLSAIFLGIIQGLTEFIPVSSSGHLDLAQDIFNWHATNDLAFDVFLHWGTLLALVIYFYKDIIRYLKAFLQSLVKWDLKNNLDQKISWLILVSMIPAVFAGIFLNDLIDSLFRNVLSVAIFLILVGLAFLIVEKLSTQKFAGKDWSWSQAIILGLAQAVALIPGVSRSGATIATGLALNFKREEAARFSFLMSIPIIFAAGAKKIWDIRHMAMSSSEILAYGAGFLAAAIIGYLAIKFLLEYLKNHSLNIFAYYRLALGLAVIIYILVK